MDLVCADDATLALIVQIQKEDAKDLQANARGKHRAGEAIDGDVALQLYLNELFGVDTFASDRKMACSLQMAVVDDSDAITRHVQGEDTATHDHALAVALSQGRAAPAETRHQNSTGEDELVEKLSRMYIPGDAVEDQNSDGGDSVVEAESSSWAASRKRFPPSPRHDCMACGESVSIVNIARAPCQHEYCRDCLETLFKNAMVDRGLFPPRCCKQAIPLEDNILFLKEDTVTEFRKKRQEFATPNPTYCHRPQCSAFIPAPNYINGVATCPECQAKTCTHCKGVSHSNRDCPHDELLQQTLDLARREGWQRCQRCWAMVELNYGCNHMTCKCGAQFCYICGVRWKECRCQQWDEHRLLERAIEIDVRDHPREGDVPAAAGGNANIRPVTAAAAADDNNRQIRVGRLMDHLRQNHECTHERWRGRPGPRECEECGDVMPIFIYECRQCHIMACRRCRYNRL